MSLWDLFQERDLQELRQRMNRLQSQTESQYSDSKKLKDLTEEVIETRLRVDVMIKLLIAKGVFSAEEFAGLLTHIRSGDGESA